MKNNKRQREKAGVVAYRIQNGDEPLVLIISSRKFKGEWVLPVGSVEDGESLADAAKRECEEESGYKVAIGSRLPSVQFEDDNVIKRFAFFMATVVGEADQWEKDRQRKWLPLSQLVDALPGIFKDVARAALERMNRST